MFADSDLPGLRSTFLAAAIFLYSNMKRRGGRLDRWRCTIHHDCELIREVGL
jgi:hypothetical protein